MSNLDTVVYRPAVQADYEVIRLFLCGLGWSHRLGDAEQFRRMMDATQRTVVAVEGDQIVGFARALCDGMSNGYLSMVAVAADRRQQGIGRRLVEGLLESDPGITWVLRAGRESAGFWEKLGFANSTLAMEKGRSTE